MTFVKIIKKSFYFLWFPMNHFDDTFWTSRTFFKNNFRNGILGYTRYVYVTHRLCVRVLCKSDGTQCRLCLVGPRGFEERFVWSRLAHFDASKSTSTTFIALHHFRFNIRTRDWPWHISSTPSRIPLAIPHVGRAIFERDSNDQATRPTFAGWISFIVLLFLSSFRRVFDRVRFCLVLVILLGVAPTMTTILCITWIERRRCCSRSILSSAIDRQIFKTSITQATKISYIILSLLFYCYSFILESRLFCR